MLRKLRLRQKNGFLIKKMCSRQNLREPAKILTLELAVKFYSGQVFVLCGLIKKAS